VPVRSPGQALSIAMLHGVAGTGVVVLLVIAALPTKLEAAAALAVFVPVSVVSKAAFTGGSRGCSRARSWEPVYRAVLISRPRPVWRDTRAYS
jgi:hypothetical protein